MTITARSHEVVTPMPVVVCTLLTLGLCVVASRMAMAASSTATWDGGAGNWGTASQWSGAIVPNNAGATTFDVFIDGGNPATSVVTLDTDPVISNLTIDNEDQLLQSNGRTLTVDGGTLTNNGTLSMESSGTPTDLVCAGGAMLVGTGSITLSNNVNNRIVTDDNGCVNGTGHTIRGAGQLLAYTGGMLNAGVILADQAASLTVLPNDMGFTNSGTLRAADGGRLVLTTGVFTNSSGLIEALDTSTVSITGGAILIDGTMNTSGSGVLDVGGGATFFNVTNSGIVTQADGQSTVVSGLLTNDGIWTLHGAGATTDLSCTDGATLQGLGTIVLGNSGANRLVTNDSVCTNAATHTIQGAGQLLADTGGMVNQGTILADQDTALTIDPNARGFTNTGTLEAFGTGGIVIAPDAFMNAGNVAVDAGSTLSRSGTYTQTIGRTQLRGGTLTATDLIDIQGGTLEGMGSINGSVQNAGEVKPGVAGVAGSLNITGSYTQPSDGLLTITIGGPSAGTDYAQLNVDGTVNLDGTLQIIMTNGFVPSQDATFTILTFTNHAGEFAAYNGLTQANGVTFSTSYTSTGLILSVAQPAFTPTSTPTPPGPGTPTVTPTSTNTLPPTATRPPTLTRTPTHTATATESPSQTPLVTATPASTPSGTPTSTASPTPILCAGDCDGNGEVTVSDVITMVNIALGTANVNTCPAGDTDQNGHIVISEIIAAVNHALNGC